MAKHSRLVNLPKWSKGVQKGSKMINLDVFDKLGLFQTHLDTFGPFRTKINLLPHKKKVVFGGGAFVQKNHFSFQMVHKGPAGPKRCPKWSKTSRLTILDPFGLFWTTLEC